MSHLVCMEHKRRVMFIENKVIHRNDSTTCGTKHMKTGDVIVELTDTLRKGAK